VALLGHLRVTAAEEVVLDDLGGKSAELLCYLLLHPNRPHPREGLASLLWGEHCTTAQSKKYLRQTLWQLQGALQHVPAGDGLLQGEGDAIRLAARGRLTLDVALLEEAYQRARGASGGALGDGDLEVLCHAAALYEGDLLEGWYQEWCLCERERLRQLYLLLLDRLMEEHERRGHAEAGIAFGERSLAADPARERTYQRLMRLHLALGDRTGALRHYARCVAALHDEFDVPPSASTRALYERACTGSDGGGGGAPLPEGALPEEVLARLDRITLLQRRLRAAHEELEHEVAAICGAVRRLLP
jgi:DNA-binding SARP family transcriptional activator